MFRNTDRLTTMLNKRIEIWHRRPSETIDRLGQHPQVDEKYCSVWAGIIPQTGGLLRGRVADVQLARTTHKIVIRYRPDITEDMWIMHDGTRYDILYVMNPYLNNERLEIFCEVVI